MADDEIDRIFKDYRIVAVVGLSKDEKKDSHRVAKYLQKKGFRVIPVNPTADEILGEKSYPSLADLPSQLKRTVEIIDIFRPSQAVPQIVDEAIRIRKETGMPKVIWMQLGIANSEAAFRAKDSGMTVVQDRCMMIEGASREEMVKFNIGSPEDTGSGEG